MDDTLEAPRPRTERVEGDENSSGDEDGGLDWTRLPKLGAAARPIIPKRGEKDFEPASGGGSGLQLHVLDRSRNAMLEALCASRTISSKNISYGIWYPSIDRVHVTTARGIHFSTIGCSVSRAQYHDTNDESSSKLPKRLELLPEEALYLIERGALFCYKSVSNDTLLADPSSYEIRSPGAPMSVQQAFTEMIEREGMTLERYQVYAYLKRLGFVLMRADPTFPDYPLAPAVSPPVSKKRSVTQVIARLFAGCVSCVVRVFRRIDWSDRLRFHHQKTTQDIFKALRFIPCGHSLPLHQPGIRSEHSQMLSAPSPYKIFFHVYRPSTPFRKTAPPVPDFHVVVIDARTTPVPSLQELTALFGVLPDLPLPSPRRRGTQIATKQSSEPQSIDDHPTTSKTTLHPPPPRWSSALWIFLRPFFSLWPCFSTSPPPKTKPTFKPPKPNPFLALKTGKRVVVIAAVDAGNISFFRFGQGVFEEWPMI